MGILIRKPGVLTTIQDYGRYGFQAEGVSPAGVMDRRSAAKANLLVDNPEQEAVLEMMLGGLEVLFETDNVVAVCGAQIPVSLDGKLQKMGTALTVHAGQVLSFGYVQSGLFVYLAFSGGLLIKNVMGSSSTHLKSGVGGVEGRKLQSGDRLQFRAPVVSVKNQRGRYIEPENWKKAGETAEIRVLPGPQEDCFSEDGKRILYQNRYRITPQSDRMGYRLEVAENPENAADKVTYSGKETGITDGIVFGSVQIPPSGMPIVMMADRQTTGGYPKIATVISEDLPLLAQCAPGTMIRFVPVTVEEAQNLMRERKKELLHIARKFQTEQYEQERVYRISVNGTWYDVTIT